MRIAVVVAVAVFLSLALLTPLGITEAFAKGPAFDEDHTFAQSMWMIIMPTVVAGIVLVMISLYARQNQQLSIK